jgi:hypothetical protein
MSRSKLTKLGALAFAFLLVASSAVAGVGFVGTTAAQDDDGYDVSSCDTFEERAIGYSLGWAMGDFAGLLGDQNPCINNAPNVDVTTNEEAKRMVAQEALEDKRYFETFATTFDNLNDRLKEPSILDAKNEFIAEVQNGTGAVSAVTDARRAAHAKTSNQQRELWTFYRSMTSAVAHLEAQAREYGVRNETLRIGKINQSGVLETGYTFVGYADTGRDGVTDLRSVANVTLTNGSTTQLPAAYKGTAAGVGNTSQNIHPLNDDLVVQVYNAEKGEWQKLINPATFSYSVGETVSDPADTATYRLADANKWEFSVYRDSDKDSPEPFMDIGGKTLEVGSGGGDSNSYLYAPGHTKEGSYEAVKFGTDVVNTFTVSKGEGDTYTVQGNFGSFSFEATGTKIEFRLPSRFNLTQTKIWSEKSVASYQNQFEQRHDELESIDNDVMNYLGTSDSGYLADIYNAKADEIRNGTINPYLPSEQGAMAPDEYATGPRKLYMYASMGLGSPDLNQSITIEVQPGANVDGSTLSSAQKYSGQLFADSAPPGGKWEAGANYTVSEVGNMVAVVYETTVQTTTDGTVEYDTVTRTVNVWNGSFEITSISGESGQSKNSTAHETNNLDSTNVSSLNEEIRRLEEKIQEIREEQNETTTEFGGSGGGGINIDLGGAINLGGAFDWVPNLFGTLGLPVDSLAVNLGAVAFVGAGVLAVAFVAGPTTKLLFFLQGRFSLLYRAAAKLSGLTNAQERGMEHPQGLRKRARRRARDVRGRFRRRR